MKKKCLEFKCGLTANRHKIEDTRPLDHCSFVLFWSGWLKPHFQTLIFTSQARSESVRAFFLLHIKAYGLAFCVSKLNIQSSSASVCWMELTSNLYTYEVITVTKGPQWKSDTLAKGLPWQWHHLSSRTDISDPCLHCQYACCAVDKLLCFPKCLWMYQRVKAHSGVWSTGSIRYHVLKAHAAAAWTVPASLLCVLFCFRKT